MEYILNMSEKVSKILTTLEKSLQNSFPDFAIDMGYSKII